jgi:hypothetical protein
VITHSTQGRKLAKVGLKLITGIMALCLMVPAAIASAKPPAKTTSTTTAEAQSAAKHRFSWHKCRQNHGKSHCRYKRCRFRHHSRAYCKRHKNTPAQASPTPAPQPAPGSKDTIVPPTPPRTYQLPSGAVTVNNADALKNELSNSASRNVVLNNGVYSIGCFRVNASDHLWARTLGGATIQGGFSVGNGFAVHGLRIKPPNGCSGVESGAGLVVWDSWIQGSGPKSNSSGVRAMNPNGLDVQRSDIRDFSYGGVTAWNGDSSARIKALQDLFIANIVASPPGSYTGQREQGIETSAPVVSGVRRIRVSNSWIAIEPFRATDNTVFSDIDVIADSYKTSRAGIYVERRHGELRNDTFVRIRTRGTTGPEDGIMCEWFGKEHELGTDACGGTTFQDVNLKSYRAGFYFDESTGPVTVDGAVFSGQHWACFFDKAPSGPHVFKHYNCSEPNSRGIPLIIHNPPRDSG